MRNPLKSKLIVGVLCIMLAAAVAFVGIPALNRTKTSTRIAVRVRVDVPQGTKLTSEMLTAVEVGAYGLPEGIVTDQEAAAGLRAKETLYIYESQKNYHKPGPFDPPEHRGTHSQKEAQTGKCYSFFKI